MSERLGNWLATYTGTRFYPADPRPEEIHIEDIAHALSNMCRYGGHSKFFYSVAQHSLFVAKELQANGYRPYVCLIGLLHDGSEAYMVDIPTPLKDMLPEYMVMEAKLQNMIYEKFAGERPCGLQLNAMKKADVDALYAEALTLSSDTSWVAYIPSVHNKILYEVDHYKVEQEFLDKFLELTKAVKADAK